MAGRVVWDSHLLHVPLPTMSLAPLHVKLNGPMQKSWMHRRIKRAEQPGRGVARTVGVEIAGVAGLWLERTTGQMAPMVLRCQPRPENPTGTIARWPGGVAVGREGLAAGSAAGLISMYVFSLLQQMGPEALHTVTVTFWAGAWL